jgi:hypothetical protein
MEEREVRSFFELTLLLALSSATSETHTMPQGMALTARAISATAATGKT